LSGVPVVGGWRAAPFSSSVTGGGLCLVALPSRAAR